MSKKPIAHSLRAVFAIVLFGVVLTLVFGVNPAIADDAVAPGAVVEAEVAADAVVDTEPSSEVDDPAAVVDPEPSDDAADACAPQLDPEVDGSHELVVDGEGEAAAADEPATADDGDADEPVAVDGEAAVEPELDADATDEDPSATEVDEEPAVEAELADDAELVSDVVEPELVGAERSGLNGIDISGWNPTIDITKLTNTDFVIIKATEYNPSTKTYTSYVPRMKEWADEVLKQGKLLGFYHFATSEEYYGQTMQMQADAFVDTVRSYINKQQCILVLDWEDTNYSKLQTNVTWAKQWLDRVYKTTGVKPLIYTGKYATEDVDWSPVAKDYKLWGANYYYDYYYDPEDPDNILSGPIKGYVNSPKMPTTWGAWTSQKPAIYQYTSTARIPGYDHNVDVNRFYGTRTEWLNMCKKNTDVILAKYGWYYESGSYRYYTNNKKATGWLVTKDNINGTVGGNQRYWLGSNGNLRTNQLIDPNTTNGKGAGYYAFATSIASGKGGYVVRGKYVADNGYVYLANNDGKLENPGWLVTKAYDGANQRYWIDSKAHAAIPGYSTAGWLHYTLPNKGYVARGSFVDSNGLVGTANNDGRITSDPRGFTGWRVTNALGHGMQRYWYRRGVLVKNELLKASETGWWAFARPEGYVVRGRYKHPSTELVYFANNDGKLENPGWLVTNKYGQGMQRYYIDDVHHAAVPGYSSKGWHHVTRYDGFVVRGKYVALDGTVYLANNDGRLEMGGSGNGGWLVTNKYDGGRMQRYWIDARKHGAIPGFFTVGGSRYYTRPTLGYVLRGTLVINGRSYAANNNGVIL